MKTIDSPHLQPFKLLPPKPGLCQECAVDHPPEYPHDAQSLFYQYSFYGQRGFWPNWGNAIAHCSEPMKEAWAKGLKEKGVSPEQLIPNTNTTEQN